jgi:SAM-dependent methyltransferase
MTPRQQLRLWFRQCPGTYLHAAERAVLGRILPNLFGYHIMQLGAAGGDELMENSRIGHRILARLDDEAADDPGSSLICSGESLPVAGDSMDVVVLPHVLEFAADPHRLLRELERILIGEGHLVLIGFNPWGPWGLWRLLLSWRDEAPWSGHFYGLSRIRDWLSLLNFELMEVHRLVFRPPLRSGRLMERLEVLEKLGRHVWPFASGAYVLVARKRIIPLTPVKLQWRSRRSMIAAGVVEPSTRTAGSE